MARKAVYLNHPLPPKLLQKRLKPVLKLVKTCPSGIILGCPGSGRCSLVKYFFLAKKALPKAKIVFLSPLTMPNITLENCFLSFDEQINPHHLSDNLALLNFLLAQIQASSKEIICFVEKISELSKEKFLTVSQFLTKLWEAPYKQQRKIKIFFLDNPKLLYRDDFGLINPIVSKLGNLIVLPLLNKQELFWAIKRNASFYNLRVNPKLLEPAWSVCGGMGKRSRELAFLIDKYHSKTPTELEKILLTWEKEYLVSGLREILDALGERLFQVVGVVLSRKRKRLSGRQEEITLLKQLGILSENNQFFASPILYYQAVSPQKTSSWKTIAAQQLTGREQKILEYFLNHQKQTIAKEEIAQIIWDNNWEEMYSEWAISKTINRINQKLWPFLGSPLLVNVRGKGYRLNLAIRK